MVDGGLAGLGVSIGSRQPSWITSFLMEQAGRDSGDPDGNKIKIILSDDEKE